MKAKTAHGRSPPTVGTAAPIKLPPLGTTQIKNDNHLKLKIMKTTVVESGKGTNKVNSLAVNAKAENNGTEAKTNGLPLSKAFDDKPKGEMDGQKTEVVKPAEQPKSQEAPKAETPQSKTEPAKTEIKEVVQQKPVLNLEGTLKLVEELHRRKIQRDRLLNTIDTLEAFEVAQQEDAEETDSNHFQGCVLTIEDDERRKFTTKNPVIIQAVAQFVNKMCVDRLAEIEAGITIPA